MWKTPVGLALALGLSACGVVAAVQDQQQYRQSTENYRKCLAANQVNVAACEAQRLIMQTDENTVNRGVLNPPQQNTFVIKQR